MKGWEGGQKLLSPKIRNVLADLLCGLLMTSSFSGVLAGCGLQDKDSQ